MSRFINASRPPKVDELAIQLDQIRELIAKGRRPERAIAAVLGKEAWDRLKKDRPELQDMIDRYEQEWLGKVEEQAALKAPPLQLLEKRDPDNYGNRVRIEALPTDKLLDILKSL